MWYDPTAGNLIISRAAISKFSREPPERSDGAAKEPCRVFAVLHPYRVPIPVHLGRAAILARSMPAPGCVSFVSFVSFFHSRSIRVRRNRSRLRAEKTHKTHKTHMSVNYGIGPGPARQLRALCRTGRPRARARGVTGAARDLPDRSMVDPYPPPRVGSVRNCGFFAQPNVVRCWSQVLADVWWSLTGRRVPVSRRAGQPDIAHPWLSLEVKHRQRLPRWLSMALMQAERAAVPGHLPIAVLHEAGERYGRSLVLRLDAFEEWFGVVLYDDETTAPPA